MKSTSTPIDKDDVQNILNAAVTDQESYLFLRLLAKTGRRIGEILAITPADIDFKNMEVTTIIQKKKKKESRVIFLDPDTCVLLRHFVEGRNIKKHDLIFNKTQRSYRNAVYRYAKKAGIDKDVCPHSFRHYVITSLRKGGWASEDIIKITGHTSVSSLSTYDHTDVYLVEGNFREAVRDL